MDDSTRHRGPGPKAQAAEIMDQLHAAMQKRLEKSRQSDLLQQQQTLSAHAMLTAITRLSQVPDTASLLEEAVRMVAEFSGVSGVAISAAKTWKAAELSLCKSSGLELVEPDDLVFSGENPLATAAREADGPLFVADLEGTLGPRSKQRAVLRRLGCEVIIPLVRRQRLLGLLLLTGRADGSHLRAEELELLRPYVACLSMAIENVLSGAESTPGSAHVES